MDTCTVQMNTCTVQTRNTHTVNKLKMCRYIMCGGLFAVVVIFGVVEYVTKQNDKDKDTSLLPTATNSTLRPTPLLPSTTTPTVMIDTSLLPTTLTEVYADMYYGVGVILESKDSGNTIVWHKINKSENRTFITILDTGKHGVFINCELDATFQPIGNKSLTLYKVTVEGKHVMLKKSLNTLYIYIENMCLTKGDKLYIQVDPVLQLSKRGMSTHLHITKYK